MHLVNFHLSMEHVASTEFKEYDFKFSMLK